MKIIALGLLLVGVLVLSGCGAIGGSIDLGFIKVPTILVMAGILFYVFMKRRGK